MYMYTYIYLKKNIKCFVSDIESVIALLADKNVLVDLDNTFF